MWRLERYRDLKLYGKIQRFYPPQPETTMPERMAELLSRLEQVLPPKAEHPTQQ